MSIVQWNPWREFDDLFTRVAGTPGEALARSEWLPPVDITETDKDFRIDVELPAVAAKDVEVSVKDGVLTVSGERKAPAEGGGKRHRLERRWGRFSRSFRLPENVDEEHIDAQSRDGVLYLVLAKKEKARPRTIQVKVH